MAEPLAPGPPAPPFDPQEADARLHLACDLVQRAAPVLLRWLERGVTATAKGAVDFVTQADKASEALLVAGVRAEFPGDAILAEEGGGALGQGWSWAIDPLDGTTNFLHGLPHFAVSVGFAFEGEPAGGAVLAPCARELFWGRLGRGASLGDRPIHVSETPTLDAALLATGFPYDRRDRLPSLLARLERAMLHAHGVRRLGSAALDLCWVAAGRYDGFWEEGLHPWDTCAGVALLRAAGGSVSDFSSGPFRLEGREIIASNARIHNELAARVVASPLAS